MPTGAIQYAFTGASYDTAVGIVTGGEWGDDTAAKKVSGIGGMGVVIPGAQVTNVSMDVVPVDANCLLDKILKSSYPGGMPTGFPLSVGDDDAAHAGALWYIDTAEIDLSVDEALSVSYGIMYPGKPTTTANTATYAPPRTPLLWCEGAVTLDGADCDAESVKISINHGLMARHSLNQKTNDSRRHPDGADAGPEVIEVTLECFEPGGFDLLGDDLPETDLVVTAASQGSTVTTWTFTLSNCKVVSAKSSLVGPDERRMWTLVLQHDDNVDADVSSVLS